MKGKFGVGRFWRYRRDIHRNKDNKKRTLVGFIANFYLGQFGNITNFRVSIQTQETLKFQENITE